MIAKVLIELPVKTLDNEWTYKIPDNLIDKIKIGHRVVIPFGKQTLEGFVIEIEKEEKENITDLKSIIELVDEEPLLNEEMIHLSNYISDTYLCSKISSIQVMLPKALKARKNTNIKIKQIRYIVLNKEENIIKNYINNCHYNKQIDILNELLINNKIEVTKQNSSIDSLIKHDLIKYVYEEKYRYNYKNISQTKKITLNDEQLNVINEIKTNINKNDTYLIHGVTGSGKTEVYLDIIENVLKQNKEAIMLVPEISLTPQMISRIKSRFSDLVAVLHSGLTETEKYDEYRKIKSGLVRIAVGARSAVFAPFTNLGVIIIDEEHVQTYKQENNPKYHARDIALQRCKYYNCPLILGSATPSLETYARATNGIYKLLELKKRANKLSMPIVEIIDMKNEYKKKNFIFSETLLSKITEKLNLNQQIMLLLNRRGYSSMWTCSACGEVLKCPNCDVSMTYHKTSDTFRCHYCGYGLKNTNACHNCGSKDLKNFGLGTEKLEEELNKIFPSARILRMDLDTTSKRNSHEKIINDFSEHKYDILVGTQMISKGLDFPLVTLVGVLNADMSLNIPDFRSSENTYQLLSQVAGRSGRSKYPGEVIIQTYNPDHYSVINAKKHDYISFYKEEMNIRKKLKYSPYYYMILIKISSKEYENAQTESKKIVQYIKTNINDNSIVLGPSISNPLKVNNIYYFQCIIKYRNDNSIKEVLKNINNMYKDNKKVNVDIDIDPLKV